MQRTRLLMRGMITQSGPRVLCGADLAFPEARGILAPRGSSLPRTKGAVVMKKLAYLAAMSVIAVALLGGCAPRSSAPKSQKVVYLINGALGDNAFYDSGKAGIDVIA